MYNKIDGGQRNLNNKQNEKYNLFSPWRPKRVNEAEG